MNLLLEFTCTHWIDADLEVSNGFGLVFPDSNLFLVESLWIHTVYNRFYTL